MAYETGFMKRRSKKIDPPSFLANLCLSALEGSPSYNDLAARFQAEYSVSASKQAFWKRADEACALFLKSVLEKIIIQKIYKVESDAIRSCKQYKRVIVQDSTIIRLPFRLFDIFSGVANGTTKLCNARVQGVYDLLSGCFLSFSIDPYSKNDIASAPELQIEEGDLILRDRGYSSYEEIRRIITSGADCIYRHKFNSQYIDPCTQKSINLIDSLCEKDELDIVVCLADEKRTRVRLIAKPVDQETANIRRMRAKKEIRGHKPSPEILFLMSWTIFITTISREKADFQKILFLYKLRWRIEIIFKIFKSHMCFSRIHNVSKTQLYLLLTARLIMIVLCTHFIYKPCYEIIATTFKRQLSLIKFIHYMMMNISQMVYILNQGYNINQYLKINLNSIARYCTYDKRKRKNFIELQNELLLG